MIHKPLKNKVVFPLYLGIRQIISQNIKAVSRDFVRNKTSVLDVMWYKQFFAKTLHVEGLEIGKGIHGNICDEISRGDWQGLSVIKGHWIWRLNNSATGSEFQYFDSWYSRSLPYQVVNSYDFACVDKRIFVFHKESSHALCQFSERCKKCCITTVCGDIW